MDKIKNLNIAGKISDSFKKLHSNKLMTFIVYLVVILIIIGILFAIYWHLLTQGDLDTSFHENGVDLRSTEDKNISVENLPTIDSGVYSLHTWFAVDKSQYNTKQSSNYSHLIGYGHVRNGSQSYDNISIGVWIENKTNDLFIVYRTFADDYENMNYNPNSSDFNCPNTITLTNYLLNEWNLLSINVNSNNVMVYLNGTLRKTKVNSGSIYTTQGDPPLDIHVAADHNITGTIKNIRFRDKVLDAKDIGDLYFAGPKKLVLPDIRGVKYTGSLSYEDELAKLGSQHTNILNDGADLVNGALGKMNNFFRQF